MLSFSIIGSTQVKLLTNNRKSCRPYFLRSLHGCPYGSPYMHTNRVRQRVHGMLDPPLVTFQTKVQSLIIADRPSTCFPRSDCGFLCFADVTRSATLERERVVAGRNKPRTK
jgi:hypothetical protein